MLELLAITPLPLSAAPGQVTITTLPSTGASDDWAGDGALNIRHQRYSLPALADDTLMPRPNIRSAQNGLFVIQSLWSDEKDRGILFALVVRSEACVCLIGAGDAAG